jgi:hypothetical protein
VQGADELVGDLGFAYRDPDPLGPKARERFATAYGEAVVAQGEADPAGFSISSDSTGIDQYERAPRHPRDRETDIGQSPYQVGPSAGELLGSIGGATA